MNYPIEIERLASTLDHKATLAEIRGDRKMDELKHEFFLFKYGILFILGMFLEFQVILILWATKR